MKLPGNILTLSDGIYPSVQCQSCGEHIIIGSCRLPEIAYRTQARIFGYRQNKGKWYCPECYRKLKATRPCD